jgi:hypothetical protein
MKKIFTLCLFFAAGLLLAAPSRRAPESPRIPKQIENRFLFIVDSASAMRSYSNTIVQNVEGLLRSDMKGEFRQGDTIGLWTYNDTLHPEFPMEVWSKDSKATVMADTAAFLQGLHYQKRAHLENVMPALNYVIKSSERLTVILMFDGEAMIQGTPFDSEINDLQKAYARELRAAHEPFVVVFAARDGVIYDYTINYPGAIAIPHTANPEKPPETNTPVVVVPVPETNTPAGPRVGASIIMSGSKLVHAGAPAPPPVADTTPTPVSSPPAQAAQPFVTAPVSAPTTSVSNTPAPVPTPAPPPVVSAAPESQPAKAVIAPPPVAPVTNPPAPVNQPAIVVATPPPHEVVQAQTQSAPPPVVARQNPEPANATPTPPAQPSGVPTKNPPSQTAPAVARNAPVADINPPGTSQLALVVAAFALLTTAALLVVFLLRRSRRGTQQPSLISQSINRPR